MIAPLDSFRLLVAADEKLRADLAAAATPDAFLAAATTLAARHGLALQPSDLAPLVAPDPLGLTGHHAPPLHCTDWLPDSWLPCRLVSDGDGQMAVDWADFAEVPLDGIFHSAAVRSVLERPLNRLLHCRMSLGDFLRGAPNDLRTPDGFVFHMSRCGSTLIARMLAALPEFSVINEAGPVDTLLRISSGAPEQVRAAALRAMVGAFGRRPSRRWFVKLSASSALDLPLFRRAFPAVPWIFVHREPAEVIGSQLRTRGRSWHPPSPPRRCSGSRMPARCRTRSIVRRRSPVSARRRWPRKAAPSSTMPSCPTLSWR